MTEETKIDPTALIVQTLNQHTKAIENYMDEKKYREDLEPPPRRMERLPVVRGYPVPWFVAKVNGEYDFRVADPEKYKDAIKFRKCWVCGDAMGRLVTFVIGPMCTINRISGDPPSHMECATYASRNCPFLVKPNMVRREDAITENLSSGGCMIRRNPGVHVLWTCKSYKPQIWGDGWIFQLSEPETLTWHTERRTATRAEVEASIEGGLPELWAIAKDQGPEAEKELAVYIEDAKRFLPEY